MLSGDRDAVSSALVDASIARQMCVIEASVGLI